MSPTFYVVSLARIGRDLDAARRAADIGRVQKLIGEQQSLMHSMYGHIANVTIPR